MQRYALIGFSFLTGLIGFACSDSPSCPGAQTKCEGYCADLMTDEKHCGECNNKCDSGEDCLEG